MSEIRNNWTLEEVRDLFKKDLNYLLFNAHTLQKIS